MSVRKLVTGTTLFSLTLLLATTTAAPDAEADPPKPAANGPARGAGVQRAAFKSAKKPDLTVTPDLKTKVRSALDKALADFAKDKNATNFMSAGVPLGPDGDSVYRTTAGQALSAPKKYVAAGSAPALGTIPATYAIEAGEVTAASTTPSCGGEIQIAFTIKNRGAKLPAGTTAKLFATLSRASAPTSIVSSAWLNLPPLDAGATTTVQVPSLRHTKSSTGGACLSGDITVTPSFIEAKGAADYRLQIKLTNTGADATLVSGIFLAPGAASSSGGLDDDCGLGLGQRCPSGVCSFMCPPCLPPFKEINGACGRDDSIVFF